VHVREQIRIEEPAAVGRDVASALETLAAAELRPEPDSLAPLLALLAGGRFDIVSRLLAPPPAATGPFDGALLGLLLCRQAAWSGDLHAVAARWSAIRAAVLAAPVDGPMDDLDFVIGAGAVVALERTAADLGDPAAAAALHGRARTVRAQAASRALDLLAAELAATVGLLDGWPAPPAGGAAPARPGDAAAAPLPGAARAVLRAVHSLLGLEPDAPRHRLRLRPRLDNADRMIVHDIGFGDALISMEADRAEAGLSISMRQDSGGIPVTVLLEPFIGGTLVGAEVDGRPAALFTQEVSGGVIVPVQLVLDADRTLLLRLDRAEQRGRPPE
jgi:hypothetical protein